MKTLTLTQSIKAVALIGSHLTIRPGYININSRQKPPSRTLKWICSGVADAWRTQALLKRLDIESSVSAGRFWVQPQSTPGITIRVPFEYRLAIHNPIR